MVRSTHAWGQTNFLSVRVGRDVAATRITTQHIQIAQQGKLRDCCVHRARNSERGADQVVLSTRVLAALTKRATGLLAAEINEETEQSDLVSDVSRRSVGTPLLPPAVQQAGARP